MKCVHVICMLAVGFAFSPAPAQARTKSSKCTRAHSKTLRATNRVRVYLIGDRVVGCAERTGRRVRLGPRETECQGSSGCSGVRHIEIAGLYVGFEYFSSSFSLHNGVEINVADLRRGTRVRRWARGDIFGPGEAFLYDLAVSRFGSVAWIARLDGKTYEVHRYDATGDALLDNGPDIDSASLAYSEPTLYWSKGGQPYSAPMR
jgi:hypothetical protein